MEKDEATSAADGLFSEIIRFEIDNVSSLDVQGQYSPEIEVGGVYWKANVCKEFSKGENRLSMYLACLANQSTPWCIDVNYKFHLVNVDDSKNVVVRMLPAAFRGDHMIWGTQVTSWQNLRGEEKGFVNDDKLRVEIAFSITRIRGVRIVPRFDFTDPNVAHHDVALVVNGEKIYVSKQILAVHSPVFNKMFYGNFAEKNQKEIELKDVDREEFVEMLHVIYPSNKKIMSDSAEYLLKLGDRFQIACVIERAEEYLISTASCLSNAEKLRISDQYRLFGLQEHCLSVLKTTQDVKAVKDSTIYRNLSESTKDALFDRHIEIAK